MNSSNRNICAVQVYRGFGLVELMVSLLIGLLLLAVVSAIYLSAKQTFNTGNSVARLQENTRFALWFINHDLRMAGYSGCTRTIGSVLNTAAASYDANFYDPRQVVGGWEFAGTAPGDVYALTTLDPASVSATSWASLDTGLPLPSDLNGRNLVPGSDVLVVKRANTLLSVKPAGSIGLTATSYNINDGRAQNGVGQPRIPAIRQFDLMVLSSCQQADLFQNIADTDSDPGLNPKPVSRAMGSGAPGNLAPATRPFGTSNPLSPLSPGYDQDTEIYAFSSHAYYISLSTDGEPSLFRLSFSNGQPGPTDLPQQLVQGVENMQLLFGEDTDADGIANRYVAADDVVDAAEIVAMRVGLLMRASSNEDFIDESQKKFIVADNIEIQPVVDPNHLRYIAGATVQLRNRGG